MSKERELLVHALDRLKHINFEDDHLTNDLIQTIQKYLAQPEQEQQEPVAYDYLDCLCYADDKDVADYPRISRDGRPLYASPPTREPLSDDAIHEIFQNNQWKSFLQLARILEKAHGIGGGE